MSHDPDNPTPRTLLARVIHGVDAAAWDEFVQFFVPLVLLWARRRGIRPQEADDLTNEVFLQLRRKLPGFQYDPRQSFRGWLATIAHHAWADFHRRRRPELAYDRGLPLDQAAAAGPDLLEDEREWRVALIARAMQVMHREFEAKTCKAFIEHACKGRRASDVAAELGITENLVYVSTFRVRRTLNERLGPFLDD